MNLFFSPHTLPLSLSLFFSLFPSFSFSLLPPSLLLSFPHARARACIFKKITFYLNYTSTAVLLQYNFNKTARIFIIFYKGQYIFSINQYWVRIHSLARSASIMQSRHVKISSATKLKKEDATSFLSSLPFIYSYRVKIFLGQLYTSTCKQRKPGVLKFSHSAALSQSPPVDL